MRMSPFTYRYLFRLAVPLIVAGLGHSLIGATDTLFLGRSGNASALAALGIVTPIYLTLSLVSLSFAHGGQILVARAVGAAQLHRISALTAQMLYFQWVLAAIVFSVFVVGHRFILSLFIHQTHLLELGDAYLSIRIWGVWASGTGAAVIALQMGLARTRSIVESVVVIALVNVSLNFLLIDGHGGFSAMGIRGAAWASLIAEYAGLAYLVTAASRTSSLGFRRMSRPRWELLRAQWRLSAPIALQRFLSLVSWIIFFAFIENMGERPLAISSVLRVLYLSLGAIAWGVGASTNTVMAYLSGRKLEGSIWPTLHKIAQLALGLTLLAGVVLLVFPQWSVGLVTSDVSLQLSTVPMLQLLFVLLLSLSVYTIYFNGMIGLGYTQRGLWVTLTSVAAYTLYIVYAVHIAGLNLYWAWGAELLYGVLMFVGSYGFLQRKLR